MNDILKYSVYGNMDICVFFNNYEVCYNYRWCIYVYNVVN